MFTVPTAGEVGVAVAEAGSPEVDESSNVDESVEVRESYGDAVWSNGNDADGVGAMDADCGGFFERCSTTTSATAASAKATTAIAPTINQVLPRVSPGGAEAEGRASRGGGGAIGAVSV